MPPLVRDAMTRQVRTVGLLTPVAEVVALFRDARIRHVPVVDDDGVLVGIVSDRDLVGRALGPLSWFGEADLREQIDQMGAREIMTEEPVTARPDEPLAAAAARMVDGRLGCLPVVDADGRLAGILTEGDFVRLHAGRKSLG